MRSLGRTAADLARYRKHWDALLKAARRGVPESEPVAKPSRLTEIRAFGSNPGNLRMLAYVPDRLAPSPGLVVVLHGCTQSAAGYDHGAGWSTLADRHGFALLFPEQREANNPKLCFNWFQPGDTARGQGEALSIRQMVERMLIDHALERRRVFVTGLSAGGAMASVMLATYPDLFAGGGIIAGLPYGAANNVQEAFESMFQGRSRSARAQGDLVRAASPHRGPWPRISVWHGTADATVKPVNAEEIVKQWIDVHGLPERPAAVDMLGGHPRRVWRGPDGEDLVVEHTITGMAHGTPIAPGEGGEFCGAAGPFLLDAGISSSFHIAKFWGLTGEPISVRVEAERPRPEIGIARTMDAARPGVAARARDVWERGGDSKSRADEMPRAARDRIIDPRAVINRALKAAGLLKS